MEGRGTGPVPWVVVAVTVKVQPCHFLAAGVAVLGAPGSAT